MQSRKDAALRAIVENKELPIKVRREALAEMEQPSRLFLTRLANDQDLPARLRLDAARRLPGAERRLSERKAPKPEPVQADAMDENLRRILTAPRPGAPETNPKTAGVGSTEPVTVAAPAPAETEPSSKPVPRPHSVRPAPKPDSGDRAKPTWWKTSPALEQPGDGELFVRNLAARRQREMGDSFALETAGVSFAALQSASLAAEQERRAKPKRKLFGMPSCGSELND